MSANVVYRLPVRLRNRGFGVPMRFLKRAAVFAAMPFFLALAPVGANADNECDSPVNGETSCPNRGSSVRSVIIINGEVTGGNSEGARP